MDENPLKSFLVVFDNGIGMNNKTLFGEWLHTSISSKRLGKRKSKIFERNYLGSKGIGRLAAMALGRYLTVITKMADDKAYNWLIVNREKFKHEVLLSEIEFQADRLIELRKYLLKDNEDIRIEGNQTKR